MADVTMVLYGQNAIRGYDTTHTFKAALFTSSYTPNQDTQTLYSALTGEVANGNGYTTGGGTCASPTATYSAASDTMVLAASNPPAWTATGAGFTLRYVVVYDSTNSRLVGYCDFGADLTLIAGGSVVFAFNVLGVLSVQVPAAV